MEQSPCMACSIDQSILSDVLSSMACLMDTDNIERITVVLSHRSVDRRSTVNRLAPLTG